ncbi:hypothetical protein G5V59_13445 [Nocardioides sp. W3-2-3]|nr:hypothetical protein [Nocardioides convexus]
MPPSGTCWSPPARTCPGTSRRSSTQPVRPLARCRTTSGCTSAWAPRSRWRPRRAWSCTTTSSYARDLPRFDAVVHHGGAGVLGHTLAAGLPAVVWPVDYDQFDHAVRLEDAGVAIRRRRGDDVGEPGGAGARRGVVPGGGGGDRGPDQRGTGRRRDRRRGPGPARLTPRVVGFGYELAAIAGSCAHGHGASVGRARPPRRADRCGRARPGPGPAGHRAAAACWARRTRRSSGDSPTGH